MIHVGISGPIASGKTTLAKQLKAIADSEGYRAEIVSFAAGIRELVALETVPYRKEALQRKLYEWGLSLELAQIGATAIDMTMKAFPTQTGIKNRRLLQTIGTEVGRGLLGKDTWIMRTQQLIRGYEILDFAISDDLRFDNEAVAVDVHIAISVHTPVEKEVLMLRWNSLGGDYTFNNHLSETSLSLPPLFTIPIGFTDSDVSVLFSKLEYARRLRYG